MDCSQITNFGEKFFIGCDPSSKVSRLAAVTRNLTVVAQFELNHADPNLDWVALPKILQTTFPRDQTLGVLIEDQYVGLNKAIAKNLIQAQAQLYTLFLILGYPVGLVLPSVWQNRLLKNVVFTNSTKKQSVHKAKELFNIEGKLDHNQADAMLIAVYGLMEGLWTS